MMTKAIEQCTCAQRGNYCPVHSECICGCQRHAHESVGVQRLAPSLGTAGGECIAGRVGCDCNRYIPVGA